MEVLKETHTVALLLISSPGLLVLYASTKYYLHKIYFFQNGSEHLQRKYIHSYNSINIPTVSYTIKNGSGRAAIPKF